MPKFKSVSNAVLCHIKRDRRIVAVSLVVGFVLTIIIGLFSSYVYARNIHHGIAESIVRLHVVANSNSYEDQALKLYVRDETLELLRTFLMGDEDKSTVIELIETNMDTIIAHAQGVINERGFSYIVTAGFSYERFPTKHYENISLPPGYYTALRIDIGAADGHNWWCIAFPPLCFVDATRPQTPTLQNVLTAEQYELTTSTNVTMRARFRIVEFWQNIMQ